MKTLKAQWLGACEKCGHESATVQTEKATMTGFTMETKSPVKIADIPALLRLTVNAHGVYGMKLIDQMPQ
ncbi:TPA: hypothetical protein ACW0T4_003816 [Morganella morganii]